MGLFAPPLLAATAIGGAAGGLVGKFAKKRVASGIGEKMDEALPPGSAGVIAVYDHAHADVVDETLANAIRKSTAQIDVDGVRHAHADVVDETLANAIRKSTAQIDKASAKELKAGLAETGGGLAG